MVKCCPTCGHPAVENELLNKLSRTQRRLLVCVQRAGQAGISSKALMEQMYASDASGGPASRNILYVFKTHMQPTLQRFGLKIVVCRSEWRLERIGND